jgi:hypothetical protein
MEEISYSYSFSGIQAQNFLILSIQLVITASFLAVQRMI